MLCESILPQPFYFPPCPRYHQTVRTHCLSHNVAFSFYADLNVAGDSEIKENTGILRAVRTLIQNTPFFPLNIVGKLFAGWFSARNGELFCSLHNVLILNTS